MPHLPPISLLPSSCLLYASFPLSFSKPHRYHLVTTSLPSSTFPIPCHLSSAQLPNILHLQRSNLPTTGAQRRSTAKRTTTCHPPPVKCSAITRRVKNRTKMRFFLQMRKFCCTFATQSEQSVCRHSYKRRLLALVLELRNPENFTNLKQESDKCPLVCLIRCVLTTINISAWAFIVYSCW